MNKKITEIILAVIIVIAGCICYKVYAASLQQEKENLHITISENDVKIEQINNIQSSLHDTAESIRALNVEDSFIDDLGNKWMQYESIKNQLVSDNAKFSLRIDEINKKENEKKGKAEPGNISIGSRRNEGALP